MSDLLKLGGVWIKVNDETGEVSMFGRLTFDTKIIILPNKYRKDDSEPSHIIFLAPVEKKNLQRKSKPAVQKEPAFGSEQTNIDFEGEDSPF